MSPPICSFHSFLPLKGSASGKWFARSDLALQGETIHPLRPTDSHRPQRYVGFQENSQIPTDGGQSAGQLDDVTEYFCKRVDNLLEIKTIKRCSKEMKILKIRYHVRR